MSITFRYLAPAKARRAFTYSLVFVSHNNMGGSLASLRYLFFMCSGGDAMNDSRGNIGRTQITAS